MDQSAPSFHIAAITRALVLAPIPAFVSPALAQATGGEIELTGRLIDERGQSISGAALTRLKRTGSVYAPAGDPDAWSKEDGTFSVELNAGELSLRWNVSVTAKGRASLRIGIRKGTAGGAKADLGEIVLVRGVTYVGRVLQETGEPVSGVRVEGEDLIQPNVEVVDPMTHPRSEAARNSRRSIRHSAVRCGEPTLVWRL